jgi:hypothetical protein
MPLKFKISNDIFALKNYTVHEANKYICGTRERLTPFGACVRLPRDISTRMN